VLLPRLNSDLLTLLLAARNGKLKDAKPVWRGDTAVTVVMASKGYPGTPQKGQVISGLAEASKLPGVTIFHAGTEKRDGQIIAVGGRVLDVTAAAPTVAEAVARAYQAVRLIHWDGCFYRSDIGWRALNR
jgi:phosphoribosylamine--glycine ligase